MLKATVQQQAFVDFVINGKGHGALVARAGTGKTSTIMLAVDAIVENFPDKEFTVCAYNKPIADEVKKKLVKAGYTNWKQHQAATIHSMGLGLVKFHFRLGQNNKEFIVDNKVRLIVRALAEKEEARITEQFGTDYDVRPRNWYYEYKSQIEQLVRLGKQAAVGYFEDLPISSVQVWADLANHYDINGFENTNELDRVIKIAQKVYNMSLADTETIDFDDMILFPLIKNIQVKFGRDFIFLDEAQDLSRARQALAKKFLKLRTGRMFIIGDDRQAIYGFSGADALALQNLTESLKATVLPLTMTWRCPKSVVQLAQSIVPDIEAPADAKDGEVLHIEGLPDTLAPNDAILCRNTAPLVSQAYALLRAGKAAKVEGRNIGAGLIELTNRWKAKSIDNFLKKLEAYRNNEVQKAQAKDKDQLVEQINDKCDSLVEICKVCLARQQTELESVREFINGLFGDDVKDVIVLATYHRSKGREWRNVYLYDHHALSPSKFAKKDWQIVQEQNLAYVAFTRAQQSLTFVTPAVAPKQKEANVVG